MEFGITLFPDVGPEEKAPEQYYRESFEVVERAEQLGYTHVRSIEHHFTGYGGYSPSSTVMLAGLSGRTKTMKLITGAVIPAFNNPLRVAGELGMLDAMSIKASLARGKASGASASSSGMATFSNAVSVAMR